MTLIELKDILDTTGYPVAYSHFEPSAAVEPPFITYLVDSSAHFFADNKVHQKIQNARIELYTDKKDLQAEMTLEDLLDQNELPYVSTESFIESEKLFQKVYEIGVI